MNEERKKKIFEILSKSYGNFEGALEVSNPFETLIATILSAQTTDKQVNKVTGELFRKYPDAFAMAKLSGPDIEPMIKTVGVYRNKSKNIAATCKILVDKFGGVVPSTMEELVTLPGVGRKTASVVLAFAFNIPAMPVDTHVFRVTNRIGLANAKNVLETERQLIAAIPREILSQSHLWFIWHGRQVCNARKPKCEICPISEYCDYYNKSLEVNICTK